MCYSTGLYWVQLRESGLPGAARLDARNLTRQKHRCKPFVKNYNATARFVLTDVFHSLSNETAEKSQAAFINKRRIRFSAQHAREPDKRVPRCLTV